MAEPTTIKELTEQWGKTWKDFRDVHEKELKEIKEKGDALGLTKESMDKLQASMDQHEDQYNKLQERVEQIERRKAEADPSKTGEKDEQTANRKAAMASFLRKGLEGVEPDRKKDLISSDDQAGGYLAPDEFRQEMIKTIVEFSPVRALANVVTTTAKTVKWPKRKTSAAASWVSEVGSRAETTNPSFGVEEIPTHEIYARTDVSFELLEDSMFNLESFMQMEYGEQFGTSEGTAFVSGNGVGKPEGILNGGINSTNGTDTTNQLVTVDDIAAAFYGIKESYARAGSWLIRREVLKSIRLLTDAGQGYVWQPALGQDVPPSIMGRPYRESIDMGLEGTIGNNLLLFGDWRRCYTIVDRVQTSFQRDPFTLADNGLVKLTARKRLGGQVVLEEAAIKIVAA